MKPIYLTLLLGLFVFSAFSQEDQQETPFEYPFGETGKEPPRGVFGSDDRKEVTDAEGIEDFVRATAVMVPKSAVKGNKVYGQTLRQRLIRQYGNHPFNQDVKFLDQPTSAYCTGFLIAPDILVTAGHCIETMDQADDYYWIFDYTNELHYNKTFWNGYVEVDPKNIYTVSEVMDAYFKNLNTMTDYSVLRLDRKAERAPYRFRTSGKVSTWSKVSTIGSPTGLPLKYADNATVVDNSPEKWFKNNIDGFPGNSGGPVFNPAGFIEGIHVRGAVELQDGKYTGDYKYDYDCNCIKTVKWWSTLGTAGSHAHRITKIPAEFLHEAIYDNIEYAIVNKLNDRLDSWLIYGWMLDYKYTEDRGRLELLAAKLNNNYALEAMSKISDAEVYDSNGRSLLFYAIDNSNLEMLESLLANGLDPDIADNYDVSPLFYAYSKKDKEAVLSLLNAGANPNQRDKQGNNLLHFAAADGDLSFVKDLVNYGINPGVKNNRGNRPEKIAKNYKHKSIRKYLKKARKRRR